MSGYNYNANSDDDDQFVQDNSGGGLRKMLESALTEIKELKKQLNGEKREETATALLKAKGLDPAIAELIPAEMEPKDWLEKYAHLLGVKDTQPDNEPIVPDVQIPVDDDPALVLEREALEAMQSAAGSGSPAAPSNDALEALAKFEGTEDELMAFFQKGGVVGG